MSIAAEIQKLKELLDCGAITSEEFHSAKHGLLKSISAPKPIAPSREHFLGKWKIEDEIGEICDVLISPGGKCELDFASSEESGRKHLSWLLGMSSCAGQWWLEGSNLRINAKLGNAAARFFVRLGEKNAETEIKVSISITEVSGDSVKGFDGESAISMWRLK